jgi:hypothetical protein
MLPTLLCGKCTRSSYRTNQPPPSTGTNMTPKAKLNRDIQELIATTVKLQAEVDSMPDDKPTCPFSVGDTYYCLLYTSGTVHSAIWQDYNLDYRCYAIGNAYPTRESATQARDRQLAIVRVNRRIDELNEGWTPDWSTSCSEKYYIIFDGSDGTLGTSVYNYAQFPTLVTVCKTGAILSKVISEHESDLLLILRG